MTPRKDPHAVALGRKGGAKNTDAQLAARRRNAVKGGRKPSYRIAPVGASTVLGGSLALEHRAPDGDTWARVEQLTPAMLIQIANWMREHKPRVGIDSIDGGLIKFSRAQKGAQSHGEKS